MPGGALNGAGYLLRGFRLINRPGIRPYAVLPLVVTVVVFALLVGLGINYFGVLLGWLLPSGDAWWETLLRVLLWPVFASAVALVMYFSFTLFANLIGAPFNGLLAEKVEAHLTGSGAVGGGLGQAIKDFVPAMLNELRKFGYYLLWAVPLLVLFLIPGFNVAAPVLWALFMAWMLVLEYVEYPMENHRITFKQVRKQLAQKRMLGLGFGAAVMGVMLIPVVNLLVMPAAVAGATAMWVEQIKTEG